MNIPLSKPDISEGDIEAVIAVLRTSQLSLGPELTGFESDMAGYIGAPHAIGLSSGTAGLVLALEALGIGEGDEVILPSFTFIATANAVLHRRATPVFADVDPVTLNLTADTISRVLTGRSRAILLVHTFGYPVDIFPILELARGQGLRVVEDACEAVGAECGGRKAGSLGDLGVFSFYPNKPMTTGEGGIVVTANPALDRTIRALRNQGRTESDGWLEHSFLGANYRLSEMNCALGRSQLKRIDSILTRREAIARGYCELLRRFPDVVPPPVTVSRGRISWFAFVVKIAGRDRVASALTRAGIGCRAYFPPIHLQPLYSAFRGAPHSLPVTEDVAFRTLALPFFTAMRDDEIERVCRVLGDALASGDALR